MKFSSPGVLLIAAVAAAGGIFLLDVFQLHPQVEQQKWTALRQRAAQAERAVQLAMQGEQRGLVNAGAAWANSPELVGVLSAGGDEEAFAGFARQALAGAEADLAWLWDGSDRVVGRWRRPGRDPVKSRRAEGAAEAAGQDGSYRHSGLIPLAEGVAVFARQDVVDKSAGGEVLGRLYLARYLSSSTLERIGSAIGGHLVVVVGDRLPEGMVSENATGRSLWMAGDDTLAVAWPARDGAGRMFGYFRADLSVTGSFRQAIAARKTVLIVLALSVGLALLVIMGMHILIAGPVVRLLKRLKQIESGDTTPEKLTCNLHGEPLLLARQLESAFDKLATMSKTDQLTGLANRRYFEQVLSAFYNQARRYNRPLSLLMIDVDFLKDINDTGGHQLGDQVLRATGRALEQACRQADLPARIGGDEFCVLAPETSATDVIEVAERIQTAIAAEGVEINSVKLNVTVSIGVADLNSGEIDSAEAMMALADEALYRAKKLGRNRLVQAHDLHGPSRPDDGEENSTVVNLKRKLAGLDNRFRDLFLRGVEELLGLLVERSPHMADHARKVRHYAALIAGEMGLPRRVIKRLETAAMVHDIGMIALPDAVLLGTAPLSEEQVQIVRRHPLLSVRIMEGMEFLEQEIPAVRYHHERYDGKGYPEGIAGSTIPLTARILSVADSLDAMTSSRCFRHARTLDEALGEVRFAAGSQFDPVVVDALLSVAERLGEDMLIPAEPVTSVLSPDLEPAGSHEGQ